MQTERRVEESKDALLAELKEFLRMSSISARADEDGGFRRCAEWVADKLRDAGAEASIMETEGHPVVYAEIGGGDRTLLSYGHYDVQPPEPLDLWESEPFEPTVRDGSLYARGVADDKGDVLARIQALRLYVEEHGPLPFKLKFLIEGEEEVGSPNLARFVRNNADLLAADACLWEGSMKDEAGRPSIECGTKGMAYVELRARGASHDLHSMYGGIAPNPVWRLVGALRTIKDESGEITLDGLDDLIEPPSEEELEAIRKIPFDDAALKNLWGVEALVKMDFRLVKGQSSGPVLELLRAHLDRRGFGDVEVVDLHGVEAAKTPVGSPVVRTAVGAWEDLGRDDAVVFPTIGGSGPTSLFATELGIPTIMTGNVANAGSRIHSPNESVRLDDYFEALGYFARYFERFGREGSPA